MTAKYSVARFFLEITTVIGAIAALLGGFAAVWGYMSGHNFYAYGVSSVLVLNGFLAIAGSQMGAATLDTAIATREMADSIAKLVERDRATKAKPEPVQGLRATR